MPESCSIEGCEKPAVCRGWCPMHYTRWSKHGDPLIVKHRHDGHVDKGCSVEGCEGKHNAKGLCGRHYAQLPDQVERTRQYERDRRANDPVRQEYERQRQRTPARRAYRQAWGDIHKDWGTWWERHRILQDKADLRTWAEREQRRQRKVKRATRSLGSPRQFIAGTCPDCGKVVVVVRGWWHDSIRCPRCTKRRWQQNHKQRAEMRGVEHEDIDPAIVFARDKRRCQICGKKTRGKYPAPTSATIDHITPLSKGGPHLMHNVQTACLRCNVKKHNGTANDQLRLQLPV